MAVEFKKNKNELLLCYTPESTEAYEYVQSCLDTEKGFRIRKTFNVKQKHIRKFFYETVFDSSETFCFCIGQIGEHYTKIDQEVIPTKHTFYFANDIKLKPKYFIACRGISILTKLDELIERDFYIGGNWEEKEGIPLEVFLMLLKKFPTSAELTMYAHKRISSVLQEYFFECDKYEVIYQKYMDRKNAVSFCVNEQDESCFNEKIEYEQFSAALEELVSLLEICDSVKESLWQNRIHRILQLLYPQYILFAREIAFHGMDGYNKRPDFTMVDVNGFVDLLEIKRPDVKILTEQASYRNNYVPTRAFSGAVQQMQKYIVCLSSVEKSQKKVLSKLSEQLPQGVFPRIINPQGILLLGRSKEFNIQQKCDFEMIKRQYKNITDIMTYDDLIQRLQNIKASLEIKIDNEKH